MNHHPRVYDVEGEPLKIKVWTGEKDLWFDLTEGELWNLCQDGFDALRRIRDRNKRDLP